MLPGVERILIDRERIAARVRALGAQIAADVARTESGSAGGDRVVLVPILTGAMVFVADLIRQMPVRLSLGVVTVSTYPGASVESRGASMRGALPQDLGGKHVLIVDDVLDSGGTIGLVRRLIAEQRPASLRACVLLRKARAKAAGIGAEYIGFEIGDEFVVGYGLDYDGHYRNLADIAVLGAT